MRNESANLTESERLQRVAEILCEAILRSTAGEAMQVGPSESVPGEDLSQEVSPGPDAKASDEQRVVHYLAMMRAASPLDIRSALGLSRSTAWRVLQRLAKEGRIVGTGQTRQLMYQLKLQEPPADKLWQN